MRLSITSRVAGATVALALGVVAAGATSAQANTTATGSKQHAHHRSTGHRHNTSKGILDATTPRSAGKGILDAATASN